MSTIIFIRLNFFLLHLPHLFITVNLWMLKNWGLNTDKKIPRLSQTGEGLLICGHFVIGLPVESRIKPEGFGGGRIAVNPMPTTLVLSSGSSPVISTPPEISAA